jgi:hypothetical protein
MNNFINLSVAVAAVLSVQGQTVKFGKFSTEELEKKESVIRSTAPAEVLYSSAKYTVDWNQSTGELEKIAQITYRVKIYDKDKSPSNFLTIEVPIRKGENSSKEKLMNLKASTFNQENGGLKEYKVGKNDIFSKDKHKYLTLQTFTFPNVKNGSILEYSYQIASPFYYNIDTWYFQENIPVVKSDLTLEAHEYFRYQDDFRGQYILKPEVGRKEAKVIFKEGGFDATNYTHRPISMGTHEYVLNTRTYIAENLDGYEREAYVLNPRNILSSVRFELASYIPKFDTQKHFSTTWEQIGKDLISESSFGGELKGNNFLDAKVSELTANKTTDLEKLEAIYAFVRDNYKWNSYDGKYTDSGVKKTFNEKSGNVADINLMLTAMLRKAGLQANPVVLSTVQNGLLNYVFPSKAKLNYVIVQATINGEDYLMDGTEPYSKVNLLPIRALNQRGFVVHENGLKEIDLENKIMSTSKEQIIAQLNLDGSISGVYNNFNDNYFYMNNKEALVTDPKEFEKDFIEEYGFEIESFKSLDNNEGLIRNSFKFSNVQADVVNGKIIINPLLFTATTSHNLNYDKRNYNLEFGTPMTIAKTIKIKIPNGYKVETLPKEYQEMMINDAAGYAYKVEEKDGLLIINSAKVQPYSTLPSDYYSNFKGFMNKIVEAETQNVVLVKQ